MADGQQNQGQQFNNDYFLNQQAARMLNAIHKGYNDNFQSQVSMTNTQSTNQQVGATVYMNHQASQQQPQQQVQQQQVQHQQLQHQLQQVQQAQQQFQQMQQLAQIQQQFQQYPGHSTGNINSVVSPQTFCPSRRGRKPHEKKKRKRHTSVKRPCTAYLYFVSKYRETLKEAGEVVPKAKIITQACAEKWRNMSEEEKEPFLELSRRDRERWQKDKALEKKPKDPNRPKRPPSAYFLFLADFRKNYPNKTDPAKEITKKAGEAWNNLTDEEKAPYYRAAQAIRAQWERDVEAYRQSNAVVQEKNGSLSRTSSVHSEQGQLEMGCEDSPIDSSHINPSLMQSGSGLMGGQELGVADASHHSPATGEAGTSSIATSTITYGYPHHMVSDQSGLQFPGR